MPRRDLVRLKRTVERPESAATPIPHLPLVAPELGRSETFWLSNIDTDEHFTASMNLRYTSDHAHWYVQDGLTFDQAAIERAARAFEERVFSAVQGAFAPNGPALPDGQRLSVLTGKVPGVAGYFSSSDMLPRDVNPYSNERFMITINSDVLQPGTSGYEAVLAHEFAHAVSAINGYNPATWLNEGSAELASDLAGFPPSSALAFLSLPEVQLNGWSKSGRVVGSHYGGAYLFLAYLFQHYGGPAALPDLLSRTGRGTEAVDEFVRSRGAAGFDAVFDDWLTANLLDAPAPSKLGYPDDNVRLLAGQVLRPESSEPLSVVTPPYTGRYYRIEGATPGQILRFAGTPQIPVLANTAPSGQVQWWSNRGDLLESSLMREFDLTNATNPHLEFSVWYDIEANWDYGYLQVSTDGGQTWQLLETEAMSRDDLTGNNLGAGWTGVSGGGSQPAWIRERVDLSRYAGQRIQLRFLYVTDEAFERPGLALDDIRIPAIGFADDVESAAGWTARGFLPLVNSVTNSYTVRLVDAGPPIRTVDVPLDAAARGEIALDQALPNARDIQVIVASHAPATTETAPFTLTVTAAR